ncbi:PPE family protein [Mycobacterium spongiae]|uniref:PPE domain-containing protein n=1 Tax=Mycobacterium spongiae TaxID=886343 RepID=A0A975JW28_9MYCO|nr:PPE family protein [Mycobacterium spongiae]QUR66742.1 PPE domain-containing protein [Mycobacterium spongiae]
MDFALLPPEVNSARMYTGPGSTSMLAAAGTWDALAAELSTTAETYGSILSGLTTLNWRGPASESMAATAAPYVGWLYATAEQTRQTAIRATAAATAFEQAYAMTVPPPVIAANRAQLLTLIATNFFGQNTAAIAATEAQYAEMWAQDAVAMYGYATSSAAATQLTPFSSPQQTANPAGQAAQAAAVNQASASAAATDALLQFIEAVSQTLQALPTSLGIFPGTPPEDLLLGFFDEIFASFAAVAMVKNVQSFVSGLISSEKDLGILPAAASLNAANLASLPASGPAAELSGVGARGAVLASAGRAGSIGQLSVPASWAAPSTRTVAALSPAGLTTLPGTEVAGHGTPIAGMPIATANRASGVLPRYGVRLTVMAHPPAAG